MYSSFTKTIASRYTPWNSSAARRCRHCSGASKVLVYSTASDSGKYAVLPCPSGIRARPISASCGSVTGKRSLELRICSNTLARGATLHPRLKLTRVILLSTWSLDRAGPDPLDDVPLSEQIEQDHRHDRDRRRREEDLLLRGLSGDEAGQAPLDRHEGVVVEDDQRHQVLVPRGEPLDHRDGGQPGPSKREDDADEDPRRGGPVEGG